MRTFETGSLVASSADGSKLQQPSTTASSTPPPDSGATWTAQETHRNWWSVASSADGSKLVAAVHGGQLYTSTDSGVTWTARETVRNWTAVALSADGRRLAAAASTVRSTRLVIWEVTGTMRGSTRNYRAIASSADGRKLLAAEPGGKLYTSAMAKRSQSTLGTAGSVTGGRYEAIELQHMGGGLLRRSSAPAAARHSWSNSRLRARKHLPAASSSWHEAR